MKISTADILYTIYIVFCTVYNVILRSFKVHNGLVWDINIATCFCLQLNLKVSCVLSSDAGDEEWKQKLRERRVSYIKSIGRNFWNLYTYISLSLPSACFFSYTPRELMRASSECSQQCNFLSAIIMYVSEFVFCRCCEWARDALSWLVSAENCCTKAIHFALLIH